MRGEVAEREPGPEARQRRTARGEQPAHAAALAAPRLEELEHALVGAARLAGERVAHDVLEPVVADAHRIGVAQRDHRDLVQRPRPDAGQRRQPPPHIVEHASRRRVAEAVRVRRRDLDRARPAALDAPPVIRPRRRRHQPLRLGRQEQRGRVSGSRRARAGPRRAPSHRAQPSPPRRSRVCVSTTGTSASITAPVRPIAQAGKPVLELGHQRVHARERRRVVVGADQRGHVVERARGARTPGPHRDRAARRRRAGASWRHLAPVSVARHTSARPTRTHGSRRPPCWSSPSVSPRSTGRRRPDRPCLHGANLRVAARHARRLAALGGVLRTPPIAVIPSAGA